jgi:uncharacterized protein YjbI with pentapeptide repeats
MIIIRCQTGDDIIVEVDSLIGIDLSKANLHRALLDGQVLSKARLLDKNFGRHGWRGRIFRRQT